MMEVLLSEMSQELNVGVEMRTGRDWMVLMLGLSGESNRKVIEAVKEFLERMWCLRNGQ